MLVVVNDFLNFRYLNLIPNDFKYQSLGMYQVHCKLPFTVTNKWMISPDPKLDEHLNGISGMNLIYTLLDKPHSTLIESFGSNRSVCADLFDLMVLIVDLHNHLLPKFYPCGKTTIAAK